MSSTARHQIIEAFMRLIAERGLGATTTRAVAEAANINEVTLFRLFTDKEGLMRAAFQEHDLASVLAGHVVQLDLTEAAQAYASVCREVLYLRDLLWEHAAMLQFGISEQHKYEVVRQAAARGPMAARAWLTDLLEAVRPWLAPTVEIEASVLVIMGLLLLTVLWQQNGWQQLSQEEWDTLIRTSLRPLFISPPL